MPHSARHRENVISRDKRILFIVSSVVAGER